MTNSELKLNFPTTDITIAPLNFDLLKKKYEEGGRSLTVSKFKSGNTAVSACFSGQIFTNGLNYKEFDDGGKSYTLGMEISDEVLKALKHYEAALVAFGPEGFTFEPLVKGEGVIFLKFKVDGSGKHFAFKSNLKLTTKNYSEISQCSQVTVTVEVSAYFNFVIKKMGIYFTVKDTVFV